MFKNTGSKLRTVAKWLGFLGVLGALVWAVYTIANEGDVVNAIVTALAAAAGSLLVALVIHTFGDMAVNDETRTALAVKADREAHGIFEEPSKAPKTVRRMSWSIYMRRYGTLYLLLLLPIIFFLVFRYYPMQWIALAFKKNDILTPLWQVPLAKNNGFEWFIKAFNMKSFRTALSNTLTLNLMDLICGFPAPIILALLLNELTFKRFKKVTQTILYLPHFLSWIIISGLATRLLADTDGMLNILHRQIAGSGASALPFLSNPSWWRWTYIVLGIWKEAGWGTIIYLAALTSISPELYEAAAVDGAGRFRRMWHVTLPGLRPTIVILLIMRLGGILGSEFDRPLAMSNKLVTDVSNVISIYVYNYGLKSYQYSLATAVGLFQSVVGVILLVLANTFANRMGERGIM